MTAPGTAVIPRFVLAIVAGLAGVLLSFAAHADPIGLVKVQSGEVHIERQGARVAAAVGGARGTRY